MKAKTVASKMSFDREKYKVYSSKHWSLIFWMINPFNMINELILGQRIPKVSLVDKTSNKPLIERSFIPCPHCQTMHDGRIWSGHNRTAFKNWFGLYCPSCGEIIPCIQNVFSWLLLAISYPFWRPFKKDIKNKWLEKQAQRYQNMELNSVYNPKNNNAPWIKLGLSWGFLMFITMSIIYPYLIGRTIGVKTIILGLVIWTIGGLIFGYVMMKIMLSFPKKTQ